jgi:acyl-CoA synthetase (AMP-forming)/AMP-acid ligase II
LTKISLIEIISLHNVSELAFSAHWLVFVGRYMSFIFADIVVAQSKIQPSATAITYGERNVTWGSLHERSEQLAVVLQQSGVLAGDRVGLLMKNTPEFHEGLFACNKIGAIAVGLNFRLSALELSAIIDDAQPKIVVADQDCQVTLDHSSARHVLERVITLGSVYEDELANVSADPIYVPGKPNDPMLILYSSGTTGRAKGITLSNTNFSYIKPMATDLYRMNENSIYLLGSPLFHIGGVATGSALMTLGGRTVLMRDADPRNILELIERERVTHTFFVPAVIQRLVEAREQDQRDLSSLEILSYGAAPMTEVLLRRASEVLGCGFLGVYGMTETSGTVTALFPEEHDWTGAGARRLQSVGRPLPWVTIALRNPETRETAPLGSVGEIWIKSEANTLGYFNNPAETQLAMPGGGWLRTGDGAVLDEDGFVFLKDRIKDMIISGGENVYPAEVENVLADHPCVFDVAVIGVPDEKWGETVKAVIVPAGTEVPDASEIIGFARERLAHYKCPNSVEFLGELPRNATGKVLKTQLRRLYG